MHRALLTVVIVFLSQFSLVADDLSHEAPAILLVGDETPLIKVKADPNSFVGKTIFLTGGVGLDDYYNFGYSDAEDSHSSLEFVEAIGPRKLGEHCFLYLRRDIGAQIIETITQKSIKAATDGSGKQLVRIRAKVVLNPRNYRSGKWELFELLDVQFAAADGKEWGHWVIESELAAKQQAARNNEMRTREAALKAKQEQELQRQQERAARTRKWSDASGKFSIVAEYSGMSNGKVLLRKKDGKTISVAINKLSDADRAWLEARRKNRSTSNR